MRSLCDLAKHQADVGNTWVAGTAWGLAYMMLHHIDRTVPTNEGLWGSFVHNGGNMLRVLESDPASVGLFFAAYPLAAKCIKFWKEHQVMHPFHAVSAIAQGLARAGDNIPCSALAQTLEYPDTSEVLVAALRRLGQCQHTHPARAERLQRASEKLSG